MRAGEEIPANERKIFGKFRCFFYWPGLALDPEFWGPVLAAIRLGNVPAVVNPADAWLPGSEQLLLHRELKGALAGSGFTEICEDEQPDWTKFSPSFALSVNFRGLDSEGEVFHILRELAAPPGIWLVDNPWHLLNRIKFPWWREASLFVTDKSFIPDLKKYGAKRVYFCPLATAPHFWRAPRRPDMGSAFVGRLGFPGRKAFFGSARVPEEALREALTLLKHGSTADYPDYHWWTRKLSVKLWPGVNARLPGAGADLISAQKRLLWVREAAPERIYGDDSWKRTGLPVLPPTDYYGSLADIYASARAILNVTSTLLPQSLNQRHFDVWAAGGVLLTDATPGLEIFPEELTKPIILASPAEFAAKNAALLDNPKKRRDLVDAWRHCLEAHTYEKRIEFIRDTLNNSREDT